MEAPVLEDVHVRVARSLSSDSNTWCAIWQFFCLFWQLLCEKMMTWKQGEISTGDDEHDGFSLV